MFLVFLDSFYLKFIRNYKCFIELHEKYNRTYTPIEPLYIYLYIYIEVKHRHLSHSYGKEIHGN